MSRFTLALRLARRTLCATALGVCLLAVTAPSAHAEDVPAEAPAADDAEVSEILKRIQGKYESVDLMNARFAQKSTSPLYGDTEQSGSLTVQRPKKMRWDFEGEGKQFVSDGETMWVYSKKENQVIRYTDFGGQGSSADAILQSLDKLGALFDVSLLEGEGIVLGLMPKDEAAKAQVKHIRLTMNDELELREVAVTDAYDGLTTLRFETVTLGGSVAPGTFDFEVPEGAEVVDVSG